MSQKPTTTEEIDLCRAALADPTVGLTARNYARGYLALHDATWLSAFDRGVSPAAGPDLGSAA